MITASQIGQPFCVSLVMNGFSSEALNVSARILLTDSQKNA